MKDKIIELLGMNMDTSYTYEELAIKLENELTEIDYEDFNNILNELIKDGIIYLTKKEKYMLLKNSHLLQGKLQVITKNDNKFGFVLLPTEDLFIASKNFNGANDGDVVIAEAIKKEGNKTEGRVIRIVERPTKDLVGEITMVENKPIVTLENKNIEYKINLIKYPDNLVDGLKVTLNLINKVSNNEYDAEIAQVLGHKNAPGIDITVMAHEFGVPTKFSEEVLEEVKKVPGKLEEDEIEKSLEFRRDLRDKEIFTIDGADTKDIDDAISLEILKNGNYLLGVHIADVSFYVRENTELKKEAFNRGNSYYLADRVIPMLPVELSNGICSLNPDTPRNAVSCEMEIDKTTGEILKYDIFKSVIMSRKKMTYTDVNKIFNNEVVEGYEAFSDTLLKMRDTSDVLRKNKVKRGYIEFESDEVKIIVDENGCPTDIKKRESGRGEELIEDFMIAANESVGSYIFNMDLPFIYRIHDKPSEEKLKEFATFVSLLGYSLDVKLNYDNVRSTDIQKILKGLKDKKEYKVLSDKLLRSMSKAEYSPDNIGHFGLGSEIYTHFTSPIRRYSDLMVHYFLDEYIFSGNINNSVVKKYQNSLSFITEHISKTERNADDLERAVNKMKIAEYMENHIGEDYEVIIDGLNSKGFFVETENLISGFVSVESLKGYYTYKEDLMAMVGKNNDMYKLGDKLKVRCVRASKEDKQVDFEVIERL